MWITIILLHILLHRDVCSLKIGKPEYEIGDELILTHTYRIPSNGIMKLKFIENISNPLEDTHVVVVKKIKEIDHKLLVKRGVQRHPITGLPTVLIDKFNYVGFPIQEEFELSGQVMDSSIPDGSQLWVASVLETLTGISISIKDFKVKRTIRECAILWTVNNTKNTEVTYQMTTSPNCVSDLTDIQLLIYPQNGLKYRSILWFDYSIKTDKINLTDQLILMTFERFYMGATINFALQFDSNPGSVGGASISELHYIRYDANVGEKTRFVELIVLASSQETIQFNFDQHSTTTTMISTGVYTVACNGLSATFTRPSILKDCFMYDKGGKLIIKLPLRTYSLTGFNHHTFYGTSQDGNFMKLESYFSKLMFSNNEDDMTTSTFTSDDKRVDFYGLMVDGDYVLRWVTNTDCQNIVGKKKDYGVKDCDTVKMLCPEASTGDYYISDAWRSCVFT